MSVILTLPHPLLLISPSLPTLEHITFTAQLLPITDTEERYERCENDRVAIRPSSLDRVVQYVCVDGVRGAVLFTCRRHGMLSSALDKFSFTWDNRPDFSSSTLSIALCALNDTLTVRYHQLTCLQALVVDILCLPRSMVFH